MPESWDKPNDGDRSPEVQDRELRLQAGRGEPPLRPSPYCMTCFGLGFDPATKAYCKCRYDRYRYGLRQG